VTVEQINTRLEELKVQRGHIQGQETEVYARIVGYYRSVKNWNKGKKEEYGIRVNYSDYKSSELNSPEIITHSPSADKGSPGLSLVVEPDSQNELAFSETGTATEYLYFFRETCPNCPPVSAWLEGSDFKGRSINVDRESGMHEALRYDITAAPTVVLLDEKGNETGRGSSVAQLDNLVGIASAAGA